MPPRMREPIPGPTLRSLPIKGHRTDFDIHPPTFRVVARCQCGWRGDWWDRADHASAEWREHVGIDG